jgi:hypothetical protein
MSSWWRSWLVSELDVKIGKFIYKEKKHQLDDMELIEKKTTRINLRMVEPAKKKDELGNQVLV